MLTNECRPTVRFGSYEADFEEGVLRKFGLPVKLQGKPLAVLWVLVENAGEIVSREQLQRSLWPDNTFVDFDKNLSTAVNKLRDALCDHAIDARYIETIPRKGYRFRAAVERVATVEPKEVAPSAPTASALETPALPIPQKRGFWASAVVLSAAVIIVLVGALYSVNRRGGSLSEKDTVVLADFDNRTGDAVFDDALKTALAVSLRQSPFLNVLPESQVGSTLQLMLRPAGARLTPEVARELCIRAGSRAYLAGAIGSLGTEYVLKVKAVNCQTGALFAEEQVTAASKEKVVRALGEAVVKLRRKLGESLATVQRFDVPLEQATTASLEALKCYSLAQKTARENGAAQSLPYAQRAIELDASFAMAYELAGVHYFNLAEPARAAEYITKAFQLREHASERERLKITAGYYSSVSGELEKATQTYQQQIAEYPRDIAAYNNLGIVFAEQGQYEKAAEVTRQGIRVEPSQVTLAENLTSYLLALQRFDETRQIIGEEQPRKPDNYIFPAALYALAFFSSDSKGMTEQQRWFAGKPEYENFGLGLASDTEAFAGHLAIAQEMTKRAVASAIRADRKETGAIWQARAAQREAAFGLPSEARRLATQALKLAPTSKGVKVEAALAFASAGDTAKVESLAQDLRQRFPLDTQMQSLWLPAIQAQLELNRENAAAALKSLEAAGPPLEFGTIAFAANASGSCLYPTYLRGQAYLAARQGNAASAEFQKILDHSGIMWNCWTGALAHLGVARANALQSKSSQGADADAARVRALAAYKDFITLWKDADLDLPILKQAKTEYAKLL
jgi:DNA-binding winged helix-turn-helix (wHTH) protein/tetratricopeptide (TPR) repeat protein